MDDWDEADRAKVNPVVGQAGVAAGAGASDAKTQRIITATDDPILTALALLLTISDFDTKTGALTETAPATDIASSGLNGRLQRIAQRLSSMIALLPTSLAAGGGLKVEGVAGGVAQPVSGTFFQTTQPVSAAALPLPSNAAQETGGNLAAILTALGLLLPTTDFDTKTGSLTETAPTTDTASSGLNGRLQRIAQRLTTLLAGGLPAALAANGGLKVEGVASGVAQPVSEADGTNIVLGALADAIVAAGATGSVSAKLRRATQGLEDLKSLIVLATGSNVIGSLVANQSVNEAQYGGVTVSAAATLDDAATNPTAPKIGALGMLYDPVAGAWVRHQTYYATSMLGSASRAAGTYDTTLLSYGFRKIFIYITITTAGGSTLTLAMNTANGAARLWTITTGLTVANTYAYLAGDFSSLPGGGTTSIQQVFPTALPGKFIVRIITTTTSTFNVDYELCN